MAFPVFASTTDLQGRWTRILQIVLGIKNRTTSLRNKSAEGDITTLEGAEYCDALAAAKAELDTLTSDAVNTGLVAYAQDQLNDNTYAIETEYTAMSTAITGVITWLTTNVPNSGGASPFLDVYTFDANGRLVETVVSTVQTAGLRTELDALLATIA